MANSISVFQKTKRRHDAIAFKLGIGKTPLVDLSHLSHNPEVRILAKDESQNVTGSIKARAAAYNICKAETENPGRRLPFLDASSGNYAMALAYVSDKLGHSTTLFVPERAYSVLSAFLLHQRIRTSKVFHLGINNSDEARKRASEYGDNDNQLIYLDQYGNKGSWCCHYYYTATEILEELNELKLIPTHFVSGIGSGGTLIGIGRRLKEENGVVVIGVESALSNSIQGIRHLEEGNLPEIYINNNQYVDRIDSVNPEAVKSFKLGTRSLNYGASAFANLYTARETSEKLERGVIVTVIPGGAYYESC